ncbi:ATP-binding cassette domain-containing protein [Heliobacterium gestii]|uniref:ATP-binding cassette domain-containing protein n=1 Tax=Heliomicrobium gestii TaxID=2699 RepID=A0A845LCE1_HELGE|nr:ABC transporter ATP-binding protein [Heliomicrobium gestii]MBM7866891.1 ATP-binding cassette subfamily B protein [Heliomicrobium gestii]MZP42319.1 ATP-binding cassette domain-containing protein [Heliomicrobium gestii]
MLKLYRFLRPFRFFVALLLALLFLQSLSELYLPTLMADMVNTGVITGDSGYIMRIGVIMLFVAAVGGSCSVAASYLSAKAATGFSRNLRGALFAHVEGFSLQEFDRFGAASLITRTTNDIGQLQQVLTIMLRMMISAPLMCVGGIIMAVARNAHLSLVFAAVVPILAVTIFVMARRGIPLYRAIQVKLDRLNQVLRENLTGIRVIRAFNRVAHQQARFTQANEDLTEAAIRVNRIMAALMPIMMLVLNFSIIAIVWFGSLRVESGDMLIGDLMAFIQYAMLILFSLMMAAFLFVLIPRAAASAARINEIFDTAPTIDDHAPKIDNLSGSAALPPADSPVSALTFDHVTFAYPGAEQPVLSDISFTACPGEITAIIGGTGSGKSTLLSLIPRLYDIEGGRILLDGVDIRDLAQQDLRARIGYVSQKALLFSGTIAENVRYGNKAASDEEVLQALSIAQASAFVADRSGGMDAPIAQGGADLSGGQKQRLSIARALARKPDIYLFDDSFSALDFKTDAKLRAALEREIAGAIVLIVAQRVTTIMDATRIIVLDQGRVAGIGTHRELLKTCDVYREIVASQLSEEDAA